MHMYFQMIHFLCHY